MFHSARVIPDILVLRHGKKRGGRKKNSSYPTPSQRAHLPNALDPNWLCQKHSHGVRTYTSWILCHRRRLIQNARTADAIGRICRALLFLLLFLPPLRIFDAFWRFGCKRSSWIINHNAGMFTLACRGFFRCFSLFVVRTQARHIHNSECSSKRTWLVAHSPHTIHFSALKIDPQSLFKFQFIFVSSSFVVVAFSLFRAFCVRLLRFWPHSVLVFPPFNSRRRYLVHFTCEKFPDLGSVSVTQGLNKCIVIFPRSVVTCNLPTDPKPRK